MQTKIFPLDPNAQCRTAHEWTWEYKVLLISMIVDAAAVVVALRTQSSFDRVVCASNSNDGLSERTMYR